MGQRLVTPLKTKEFGRIAAQTAKHVIRQGLREGERSLQCSEMQSRAHEIITGTVTAVDAERGNIVLDLGKGGSAVLPKNEQVPGEHFTEGQMVQVYVVDVLATERGPRVTISRTHPGLVKRMFELEVPEIYDGTVEIKAIAREAGARTKMAVWSKNPDVDPVGACIGAHGSRVEKIVEELGGEKIDIIRWSEDINEFISAALSPAKVVKVELLPGETKSCRVTVPDHQLSLAIGNKGQNVRLCAHLTGYNIDIRPESGYYARRTKPRLNSRPKPPPPRPPRKPARNNEHTPCNAALRLKEVSHLQQKPQKKVPVRRCVGCNTQKPKKELVRIVRSPEGEVSVDLTGKRSGRGAYLCPSQRAWPKHARPSGWNMPLGCRCRMRCLSA